MMKRTSLLFVLLALLMALVLSLSACQSAATPDEGEPDPVVCQTHQWDAGTITQVPTDEQEGRMEYVCSVCGEKRQTLLDSVRAEDFLFAKDGDGYRVVGYVGESDSAVAIPAAYRGLPIVSVGTSAFANGRFSAAYLPQTVTYIAEDAFAYCERMEHLIVGGSEVPVYVFNGYVSTVEGIRIDRNAFRHTAMPTLTLDDSSDGDTLAQLHVTGARDSMARLEITAVLRADTGRSYRSTVLLHRGQTVYDEWVDLGTYGAFESVSISVIGTDGTVAATLSDSAIRVTSPHYNIALLNGTYPVTVFSLQLLKMPELTGSPTIVGLERGDAYDWDALPPNVYELPYVSAEDARSSLGFHNLRPGLAAYVAELYALDPDSTFSFYFTDNYPELILQTVIANHIPQEQWSVVLLSDGAGTAALLNRAFAVDDPWDRYDDMAANWAELCAYVEKNGYNDSAVEALITYKGGDGIYQMLQLYPYVITREEDNVTWWVNRLRAGENLAAIQAKDAAFANEIVNSVTSFYTNSLLAALTTEEQQTFKQLYHFNDEMFADAKRDNKKVMIILGTSKSGEGDRLYDYVRMTMTFYGDDYYYYYKGHPGWATSVVPERRVVLDKLADEGYELRELDCAVAAELILFYNPEVYISGWQSSTFDSIEDQQMVCLLYDMTYAQAQSSTAIAGYRPMVDAFLSPLTAGLTEYAGIALEAEKKYYLIEYNDDSTYPAQRAYYDKHEIAIYDAAADTIHYYKLTGGSYVEVTVEGAPLSVT